MNQLNMFGTADDTSNILVGLKVKLDRPIDHGRPCCKNICTIGPGKRAARWKA